MVFHPLIIASALGVVSAALHFQPPVALDRLMQFLQNAAAPCALFTLGVTVALRPLKKMPWEVPFLTAVKLVLHPVLVFLLLSLFGPFDQIWVYTAVLDGGAAAGAQCVRVRASIRYLGRTGLKRGAGWHVGFRGDAHQRDVDGQDRYAAGAVVSLSTVRKREQTHAAIVRTYWCSISPRCCRDRWPALMLAEAGAEVIKIEQPGGENARRFPPMIGDESAAFAMLNRGKKSLNARSQGRSGSRAS